MFSQCWLLFPGTARLYAFCQGPGSLIQVPGHMHIRQAVRWQQNILRSSGPLSHRDHAPSWHLTGNRNRCVLRLICFVRTFGESLRADVHLSCPGSGLASFWHILQDASRKRSIAVERQLPDPGNWWSQKEEGYSHFLFPWQILTNPDRISYAR